MFRDAVIVGSMLGGLISDCHMSFPIMYFRPCVQTPNLVIESLSLPWRRWVGYFRGVGYRVEGLRCRFCGIYSVSHRLSLSLSLAL